MNTPSHFIIQAAVAKRAANPELVRSAFLWGAVAPDIPLYLLSVGGGLYFRLTGMSTREAAEHMFDDLFFQDPFWMAAHNLLHSPTMLALLLGGWWLAKRMTGHPWGWLKWFLLGCAAHTLLDIPVHHNDGPLLFFPFEWQTRFNSPVSYWDPDYYGTIFVWFELVLDGVLVGYLMTPWVKKQLGRHSSQL